MAANHIATDNVKAKIVKVRESVSNNVKKDDVAIVLNYFEQDTTKTIEAFNAGKTESILQTWFISGKKGGKGTQPGKNKRRRKGQGNQNVNNADNDAIKADSIQQHPSSKQPADPTSKETTSSAKDTAVRLPQPNDNNNKTSQPNLNHHHPTDRGRGPSNQRRDQSPRQATQSSRQGERQGERQGDGRNRRPQGRNRPEQRGPNAPNNSRRRDAGRGGEGPSGDGRTGKGGNQERRDVRENTLSESSVPGKKKQGPNLERLEKDLHRTIVSLTRCKNNLTTQLEESEKRLKRAFQEVQRQLQEREIALLNDFNDIKRQSEALIDNRQQTASDLKMKIAKASSLSEQEVLELRASLKHFVSDRKTDEEISQTMRFTYTPDQLIAEVKQYGDVNMEIGRYSSRRPSISSLSTISRTTSICEDAPHTLSRGVSLSESLKSPVSPGPKSPDMDLSAEADNFAAKIQQKIQAGRGGQQRRGPWNPSDGRGRQDGGGQRRDVSGGKDQGRRPQNNQDGPRRRQNSGSQDANRKRTNSGSAQKNNDGQKDRPPRREGGGRGGGNMGQQTRGPKGTVGEKPEQPEQPEGKVVEGGGDNQTESPKKQRNFSRRQQHRKRQGNDVHQGGSPKKEEVKEGETPEMTKPQENGPKVIEDGPKVTENGPKVTKNGPTVTENGPKVTAVKNGPTIATNIETKITPPSIEIDTGVGDPESGASVGSTPISSPGTNSRFSEPAEKEIIPNGSLTNGKAKEDVNSSQGNGDEGYHEETTDLTRVKKIIEREKVDNTVEESATMMNGGTEVGGEVAEKEEEDTGEK